MITALMVITKMTIIIITIIIIIIIINNNNNNNKIHENYAVVHNFIIILRNSLSSFLTWRKSDWIVMFVVVFRTIWCW